MCHVLYAKVRSGWISIKGKLVPALEQFDEKEVWKYLLSFSFSFFFFSKLKHMAEFYIIFQEKNEFQSQTNQQNNSSHLDTYCSSNN